MPSLLNRARVRALVQAEAAKRYRFRHGARVSSSYLDNLEADLRCRITVYIRDYTGKGITIR
jgi:hypothetical protein